MQTPFVETKALELPAEPGTSSVSVQGEIKRGSSSCTDM